MISELLNKYPIISDQVSRDELKIILGCLYEVISKGIRGDIVEMGCYSGTTSLFISRVLIQTGSIKQFHVYDSFEGLPEKTVFDNSPAGTQFKSGELLASKKEFIQNFKKANLPVPKVHKNWFSALTFQDLPESISFAFLDGDYYESIRDCLKLIENKMTSGGFIVVDDYQNEALPGAKKAVDQWLKDKTHRFRLERSLAIIKIS